MVARGYSSLSFLNDAAEALNGEDRPVYVYHFGDHDPSGVNAAETIDTTLRELSDAEIHFQRVAVTTEDKALATADAADERHRQPRRCIRRQAVGGIGRHRAATAA
jgi:hypothetical protein